MHRTPSLWLSGFLIVLWAPVAAKPARALEPPGRASPQVLRLFNTRATGLAFSPDGLLLAAGADKEVRIWDTATGKPVRTFAGAVCPVTALAFSPDGKHLAAAGASDTRPGDFELRMWDLGTGRLEHQTFEKGHRPADDGAPTPSLFRPAGRSSRS